MRYLKIYEDFTDKPKIGDYVLVRADSKNKDLKKFLRNNPGQIIEIDSPFLISVKYENIPIKIQNFFNWNGLYYYYYHTFNKKKILVFSDNPNDLELKLSANKYNL